MVNLSVNVNKIATLRNSRGNNLPDLKSVTKSIIKFGANGITIHPRPDERHIKKEDVFNLAPIVNNSVEFNIEGFPSDRFIDMVISVKPTQVTLVPDDDNVLTSLEGWDTVKEESFLNDVIKELKRNNIRTAVFIHPDLKMLDSVSKIGADRIELFTGKYAANNNCIVDYVECGVRAHKIGLGVNAGHDLDLKNLPLFIDKMPYLEEVSIGHALISESLYLGLENTINMYKRILA
ncbi:MAG: pyridoxine 5'-phosphate synthase [Flavobacteriales bacterium]|nr:pyridoxine 5'-phosphate synthase [Flavobacteriales bacterium]